MDYSMAEGDSLLSTPGAPSYRQPSSHQTVGLGIAGPSIPDLGDQSSSYEYNPNASGAYDEEVTQEEGDDEDEEGEGEGAEREGEGEGVEDEDGDAVSEGSSADYDRVNDPEVYAKRLDGLAGVLEMREDEARAIKWGPSIGRERDAPLLSLEDFKTLVNHHLASTEWRYAKPDYTTLPGRPDSQAGLGLEVGAGKREGLGRMDESWETHPIRVIAADWAGARIAERMREVGLEDGVMGMSEVDVEMTP